MLSDVMEYFPVLIRNEMMLFITKNNLEDLVEEIRLRIHKNICIRIGQELVIMNHKLTQAEMSEIFENICEKSIYSYTRQISEGFITIKGGNRVGVVGSVVIENEKVINMNYISSLNFRIARQIKEISQPIIKHIIDIDNNSIFNTIIISSPGARKNYNFKRFNKKNFEWNSRNWVFT